MPEQLEELKIEYEGEILEDIERIVRVCRDAGYAISRDAAFIGWGSYSNSMAATWLALPAGDAELLDIVLFSFKED